jgi:hypothetical protein
VDTSAGCLTFLLSVLMSGYREEAKLMTKIEILPVGGLGRARRV